VLRKITSLTATKSGLSEEFIKANFIKTSYADSSGKRNPKYLLTKDGFIMVTMEFNTAKARQFKEAYIKRFNEMAEFISVRCGLKEEFPEFTEAVKVALPDAKQYHYINEINMLYSVLLGQSVQSYKKENGLIGQSLRDNLSTEQLQKFRRLQRADIGLLFAIPSMQERKKVLNRVASA
ncbi:MAG: Rha family transcriptional regulator, partial [Clostridia bacterium]|nr:Rha family transcriptional regulator [Clostridia bacterium]